MALKTSVVGISLAIMLLVGFAIGYYSYPLIGPKVVEKTTWDVIKERGYIVVATSPDWPPFEFLDPKTGKLTGYEVELMEAVAKELGIRVEWKTMPFEAIITAVKNKEVDLGVSGFSVTAERLDVVLYALPIYFPKAQLIMPKAKAEKLGITKLTALEEIAKYKIIVGTGSGTTEEEELMDLVKRGIITADRVKTYIDFGTALEALIAGEIDAVYAETPVTTYWIKTETRVALTVVFERSYYPVAWIAHITSVELIKQVNKVLSEFYQNGFIDQLREKWGM